MQIDKVWVKKRRMDKQNDESGWSKAKRNVQEGNNIGKLLSDGVVREENKARMPLVIIPHGTLCRGTQGGLNASAEGS